MSQVAMVSQPAGPVEQFPAIARRRRLGQWLCLLSIPWFMVALVGLLMLGEEPVELGAGVLAVGGTLALGLLVPGVYLGRRRTAVVLEPGRVRVHASRRPERILRETPLSDYVGLWRDSRFIASHTGLAFLAGGIVGMLAHQAISQSGRSRYRLWLRHRVSRRGDLLLFETDDAQVLRDTMRRAAVQFSLDVLDPSIDGQAVRRPDQLGQTLVERVLADEPVRLLDDEPSADPQPADPPLPTPRGVQRIVEPAGVSFVLRRGGRAGWALIVVGLLLAAGGMAMLLAGLLDDVDMGPWFGFMFLAVLVLGVGVVASVLRARLTLSPAGLRSSVGDGTAVPWAWIESITVAKSPRQRGVSLLVSAVDGDHWMMGSCRKSHLLWLREAILDYIRQTGRRGG